MSTNRKRFAPSLCFLKWLHFKWQKSSPDDCIDWPLIPNVNGSLPLKAFYPKIQTLDPKNVFAYKTRIKLVHPQWGFLPNAHCDLPDRTLHCSDCWRPPRCKINRWFCGLERFKRFSFEEKIFSKTFKKESVCLLSRLSGMKILSRRCNTKSAFVKRFDARF